MIAVAVRIIDGGGGKVGSCGHRIWILVEATAWLDGYGAMRMVAAAMMVAIGELGCCRDESDGWQLCIQPFSSNEKNTRTVSTNLGCTSKYDSNKPINQVDVLIPKVIQVYCCHKGGYYCRRGILGMYENGFLAGCLSEVVLVLVVSGCWIFSEDTSVSGENKGEWMVMEKVCVGAGMVWFLRLQN
ncbi:hypothetical protein POTOM_056660 [Populus tomentosa]|uniref:Uncharacterized protein n=1 Tax=Populus tomentosa TaxID=118781 RepID=A0A8X7XRU3_POPTO|nr:hypothetical protein POTOM_056660 [Populus tomentosa]